MSADRDLYRAAATILMREYGRYAESIAHARANALRARGDSEGAEAFERILVFILELRVKRSLPKGSRLH